MTARFFLAGVDITRPRIEEDPGGPVRILLNDRDDWITVDHLADCALLMQAASDAASVFIRRNAADDDGHMRRVPLEDAQARHAAENVPRPQESDGRIVRASGLATMPDDHPGPGDLHLLSDGSDYEGEEPPPVLPHRQPGVALAEAEETAGRTVYAELAPEALADREGPDLWPEGDTP